MRRLMLMGLLGLTVSSCTSSHPAAGSLGAVLPAQPGGSITVLAQGSGAASGPRVQVVVTASGALDQAQLTRAGVALQLMVPDALISDDGASTLTVSLPGTDLHALDALHTDSSVSVRPVLTRAGAAAPAGAWPLPNADAGHLDQPATAGAWIEAQAAVTAGSVDCAQVDRAAGAEDGARPLLACGVFAPAASEQAVLLGPAVLPATAVAGAEVAQDAGPAQWAVDVSLDDDGTAAWSTWTAAHVGAAVAFVVDGHVASAPVVQRAGGSAVTVSAGSTAGDVSTAGGVSTIGSGSTPGAVGTVGSTSASIMGSTGSPGNSGTIRISGPLSEAQAARLAASIELAGLGVGFVQGAPTLVS